jgi:hypothetical protein
MGDGACTTCGRQRRTPRAVAAELRDLGRVAWRLATDAETYGSSSARARFMELHALGLSYELRDCCVFCAHVDLNEREAPTREPPPA